MSKQAFRIAVLALVLVAMLLATYLALVLSGHQDAADQYGRALGGVALIGMAVVFFFGFWF